jgi:spermidine synthase
MDRLLADGLSGKIGAFIIDCTDFALDEDSIAAELFTPEFYRKIYTLLESSGGFSQHISDMACKDEFTKRTRAGGFVHSQPYIVNSKTPEYGGELPLANCFKPP